MAGSWCSRLPACCGILLLLLLDAFCSGQKFSCPEGWVAYEKDVSCLKVSNETVEYQYDAFDHCENSAENATLIIIPTDEKYEFFKELVEKTLGNGSRVLLPVTRIRSRGLSWMQRRTPVHETSFARAFLDFNDWTYHCDQNGLTYLNGQLERPVCYYLYSPPVYYICQQYGKCKEGLFGRLCDKECHCHGETCDPSADEIKCSYGCEIGWMGEDCSQRKKDASVNFFCANSPDQGKLVHIRIDYNGVKYEDVRALNKDGEDLYFCNNTEVKENDEATALSIDIHFDYADEQCLGQISSEGKGQYEWRLKIQEKEGLVGRFDQEFLLKCDFTDAMTLSASGVAKIKNEKSFIPSSIKRPLKTLEGRKSKADLVVADPRTGQPINWFKLGQSVVLKMRIRSDQLVTGIVPFNCDASSPDNEVTKRLIGTDGCPVEGSPISAFYKNDTMGSITEPFQMFGLVGFKAVNFQCSYKLCLRDDPCPVGCVERMSESDSDYYSNSTISEHYRHNSTITRHRRSVEQRLSSGLVHLT